MARNKAYREAEKKIEEALHSGTTELDLSNMKLTELPESIGQLARLLKLDIGGWPRSDEKNQLTKLPESLGQLTQLQSLDLSSNQLTTLPESLAQLTQLQSLVLSHNQLTALPESLGQLTQLQSLDLSSNQLTALPESLGQLTQLQSLDLSSNQLTTLPESLAQLTQLQSLVLSHNQLTALPESLAQLTQLQSLVLSHNQLTALPEWSGQLTQLQSLNLSNNRLTILPESLGGLTQLQSLVLSHNQLTALPESLGGLTQLQSLGLSSNQLAVFPEWSGQFRQLKSLYLTQIGLTAIPTWIGKLQALENLEIWGNHLTDLPNWFGNLSNLKNIWLGTPAGGNPLDHLPICFRQLRQIQGINFIKCSLTSLPHWLSELSELEWLHLGNNQLTEIPSSLSHLKHLATLGLQDNPLNPELAEAYAEGLDTVKAYLRAKSGPQITLNQTKLILVGEGEVGKSCLMDALADVPWQEHESTHGIQIREIEVANPLKNGNIILNGWDFGGQRVYRPTHQLFFSAPAVYLVVWKPREGSQAGAVKEWIRLVKHREPEAKILVVATHGGPRQRLPDIDRQEIWDLFGKETVIDFFHVDSKPDKNSKRRGIKELKQAIAKIAAGLPEVGRSVPKSFEDVRQALAATNAAYLPLTRVYEICHENGMEDYVARLFIRISHRLGHLIHYEHDATLQNIVVLKPDWLATAISFVFDDETTRKAQGLVRFSRLNRLWADQSRDAEFRYATDLHPIFLRLMERFDLSYRVVSVHPKDEADPQSLIAQLVPDNRPANLLGWVDYPADGNVEQMQICRIVDDRGQSANAEGLFYQLIVRLHRYSLGRQNYANSVHWQRGLVLDDDYNGRALLEHKGNDVHITVRAPYPEYFLAKLTGEVKYLVESFWEGLSCDVMVPCNEPCGKKAPGTGLFSVENLIAFKRQGLTAFPCMVAGCHQIQDSNMLLRNAPSASRTISLSELQNELAPIKGKLDEIDINTKRKLSQIAQSYDNLLKVLTDEAKEGPRLFSFVPVNRSRFNPRQWTTAKFRLTLWCEHSRKPLPLLNGEKSTQGVLEIELTREWFKQAAPFLKALTGTLSLVLPVAAAGLKLATDQAIYKTVEDQLNFSKEVIDASLGGSEKVVDWMGSKDDASLEQGEAVRVRGSALRQLHSLLKAKDPSFGGLVRVLNKHNEFLWVHPQFEGEY